ncbi:MAG: hypothetical protein UR31_C0009G0004 [Parcubacteria group bacterium GW2011_GWA2_33_14]|nr:MAG: hypothetical protein UR31_C0009G0004 [Parcubacteria group bacterium GW2011_GWA2_33_14]
MNNNMIPEKFRRQTHPIINKEIESSVKKQLHEDISIYDNGGIYKEVEAKLKELFPRKYILTTCNGTSALYTMFFGANIQRGDEVIVPAYTFFATALPLFQLGALPILADCGENGNIDPISIEKKITKNTKAVVVTHMWGIPCDMENISRLCKKHNILLLEDCSHAHGATIKDNVVGTTYSDAAAWSLQGKKLLTSGEGGFIATDYQIIFERAVLLGHFNKRAKKEVFDPNLKEFFVTGLGGNLRMHPLGAAILRPQLNHFKQQLEERRETARMMDNELMNIDGLAPVKFSSEYNPAWYAYPIIFDQEKFTIPINDFVEEYKKLGALEADIPGSTCPLNRFPLFMEPWKVLQDYTNFKDQMAVNNEGFPNADKFHSTMFKLPTWYGKDRKNIVKSHMSALKQLIIRYQRHKVDDKDEKL